MANRTSSPGSSARTDDGQGRLGFVTRLLDRDGLLRRISSVIPEQGLLGRTLRRLSPVDLPARQVPRATQVSQVHRATRVLRVRRAPRVSRARQVLLDRSVRCPRSTP